MTFERVTKGSGERARGGVRRPDMVYEYRGYRLRLDTSYNGGQRKAEGGGWSWCVVEKER